VTPMSRLLYTAADPLHHNYDYPILSLENGMVLLTNHMVMMIVVFLLMLWVLPKAARAINTGKTGTSHDYVTRGSLSHIVEVFCVFFREDVVRPVLGGNTDKFLPFIWTVFFFILFNNLLGIVPLLDTTSLLFGPLINSDHSQVAMVADAPAADTTHGAVQEIDPLDFKIPAEGSEELMAAHAEVEPATETEQPAHEPTDHAAGHAGHLIKIGPFILFRDLTKPEPESHFHGVGGTATGNIAVTFALALIAILVVIGAGIKTLGIWQFIIHMTLGTKFPLNILMFVLEFIGLWAKPFALMVRLFANMTAGHVMLAALLGFCSMAWNGMAVLPGGSISGLGVASTVVISIGAILFAVFISLIEVLVALIQAYVFAFLTTVFLSLFQHDEHHEEHHDAVPAVAAG